MPTAVSADGKHRGAKYFWSRIANPAGDATVKWGGMLYGAEEVYLLWADVTPAQHTVYAADPDVLAVPTNIDNTLNAAAVTAVSNYLAAIKVPAQWINTTLTYRQVIRGLAELFQVMQAVRNALGNQKLARAGVTLGAQWSEIPSPVTDALMASFTVRGYPVHLIQPTTTMRQVLKSLAQRWENTPIRFCNGVTV